MTLHPLNEKNNPIPSSAPYNKVQHPSSASLSLRLYLPLLSSLPCAIYFSSSGCKKLQISSQSFSPWKGFYKTFHLSGYWSISRTSSIFLCGQIVFKKPLLAQNQTRWSECVNWMCTFRKNSHKQPFRGCDGGMSDQQRNRSGKFEISNSGLVQCGHAPGRLRNRSCKLILSEWATANESGIVLCSHALRHRNHKSRHGETSAWNHYVHSEKTALSSPSGAATAECLISSGIEVAN